MTMSLERQRWVGVLVQSPQTGATRLWEHRHPQRMFPRSPPPRSAAIQNMSILY